MRARGTPIICAACGTRRSRRRTGLEVRHFYRKKVVMVDCRIVTVRPRCSPTTPPAAITAKDTQW